jgi:glycosyltransferase involved in cell wall biosynthesis
MTHNPRVSVILPTWNGKAALTEAVRSILDQSFTDFELIIADDGSTDSTVELVRALAASDPRIVPLYLDHGGLCATPNAAIAVARGELIAMMDHDDISLPLRFERQVAFLNANPIVVAVGTDYVTFSTADIGERRCAGLPSYPFDMSAFPPVCPHPMHPTIMIRAAALKKIGGYRHEFAHVGHDVDMFIRLRVEGSFANLPEVLFRYRHHAQNTSFVRREAGSLLVTLCTLSGVARHYGRSDEIALTHIAAGRHREAIEAYKALLINDYPVQSLMDYHDVARSVGAAITLKGALSVTGRTLVSNATLRVKTGIVSRCFRRITGAIPRLRTRRRQKRHSTSLPVEPPT